MKVVIIGGGPAGMMSAITAAERGNNVILFEKMKTLGRKLLITGKGRCNITSSIDIKDFIQKVSFYIVVFKIILIEILLIS